MRNQTIAILLIIFILLAMIIQSYKTKRKQKKAIRENWGEIPINRRTDSEKSLSRSYENLKPHLNFDSEIDAITWYDLDFIHIFNEINHTHSSIGSEGLYRRLRLFNFDDKYQNKMEELISYYEQHPKMREKIEYSFAQLGKQDNNAVVRFLTASNMKSLSSLILFIFLGSLPILGLVFILLGIEGFGLMVLFGSITFNVIYSAIKRTEIGLELMSMRYLVQSLYTAKQLIKIDHPLQQEIKGLLQPFQSILRFSFVFRAKDDSGINILLDYLNMLFMLPFITYHFVFNRIKNHETEAIALWQRLGDLEVAYAVLNYRTILEIKTKPSFTEEEELMAETVYHPLIEEPVANPVAWAKNTLVSGSNASGKSTYVKSIAINCILAQTINTCLAESFLMKRGHVLTSMAVEDDVLAGDSYFVAEIKSLKRVLKQVKTHERCYLFIDEILRGTNTVERIAASSGIVNWLAAYPTLAFVATHDIELTEILKSQTDNVHFKEEVTDEDGITFDYVLRKGPATSRNALLLLENMNFPQSVIENAKEMANHFDQTQEWLMLVE
jgi:hypothetical protein